MYSQPTFRDGSVYIFKEPSGRGTGWSELQRIDNPVDGSGTDQFGRDITIDYNGFRAVFAAENFDGGATNTGRVYIYEGFDGTYNQTQDIQLDQTSQFQLGNPMAISGCSNRLIISAVTGGLFATNSVGFVYSYQLEDTTKSVKVIKH